MSPPHPAEGVAPVHRLFRAVAERHSDRTAIDAPPTPTRANRVRVTYRDLAGQADRVTAALAPLARPDAVVAILLGRESPALYAAQLGVLQAGAAYAGLDPGFPDDFLGSVLTDADPVAVLTDPAGRERLASLGVPLPPVFDPTDLPPADRLSLPPDDLGRLAYVVYTSGTTGTPKGVQIEHRGVAHLVAANLGHFGLTADDRVAQCSSPAYDSAVEETWLAFAVGATLVPVDDLTLRSGPDLVPWLRTERVTVLCPPPTLLRATGCDHPDHDLPTLRLLYVGGEPLPQDLADRWAAGRRMENGYGPTECTVTVVRGPVTPGVPVTIGVPVPGNRAWVLDEVTLTEVPDGVAGELCVGGVGLARGYHRRPEVTAAKFIQHPTLGRLYRTGDLARRTAAGEFEHLGRLDGQVKLRGLRVELSAIEAVLTAVPGVRAAGCRVQGVDGTAVLAAHVVPESFDRPPAVEAIRQAVRQMLPAYMVPSRFGLLDRLPTQVGGKLDRRALPDLGPTPGAETVTVEYRNDDERIVCEAFAAAVGVGVVPSDADFFLDLGGNSLSAVRAVVELRKHDRLRSATVRAVYESRTAAALADRLRAQSKPAPTPQPQPSPRPTGWPLVSTTIQGAWLTIELIVAGVVAFLIAFDLLPALINRTGLAGASLLAPVLVLLVGVVAVPMLLVAVVLAKKLLVGRYAAGSHPVWGGFYTRHWVVTRLARLLPWRLVGGTVAQSALLRVLGANIGKRVHIHHGVDLRDGGWDLLTLGDDVTLAQDAEVRTIELTGGQMVLGPVSVGDGGTVDVRAGVSPGGAVGRNGTLTPLSWLSGDRHIPDGERWDGVPASRSGESPPKPDVTGFVLSPVGHAALVIAARFARWVSGWAAVVLVAIIAEWLAPDVAAQLLAWLCEPVVSWPAAVLVAGLLAVSAPIGLIFQALFVRLLGRVRTGCYGQYTLEAVRIDVKTGVLDAANEWLSGTVFWPWWLRLAGMRVGRGCEISTIIDVVPETVTIGDDSFFADGIYLCGPHRHRGTVTVAASVLGRNTFLGNHAVLPAGHRWPDDYFVGVATVADAAVARPGTGWFGQPPMDLPRREVATADRRLTHDPPLIRRLNRVFWESLRFALPVLPAAVVCGYFALSAAAFEPGEPRVNVIVMATATLAAALAVPCVAVVGLKWLLLGRTRPGEHPLWSCWCSRWDFLYVAWGYWAREVLTHLDGTLFLNAYLRLVGVRVGRRVVLGRGFAQVVDPDMLVLDDDATATGHFQAHSFEDRVLKTEPLWVRAGATVGANAIVFYGADVGAGATVEPHAVVMKRDVLPAGGRYAGCPSRPAG